VKWNSEVWAMRRM